MEETDKKEEVLQKQDSVTQQNDSIFTETKLKKLRKFNLIMGCLHAVQFLCMLIIALTVTTFAEYKPLIVVNYLTFDPITQNLVLTTKELFNIPFGVITSLFLLVSATFHFIISIPKKVNAYYSKELTQHVNSFRWYEYAISSSIMIVLIAILFGVYDITTLIVIFLLNASMNLFGLLMEKMNQNREKVTYLPFIFGCVAGIGSWIVILIKMVATPDLSSIPWFVFVIAALYFVLFNLFPINMILQYKKVGKWKDYLYGERVYIILSLVAKSLLAWLVFAGVMQP